MGAASRLHWRDEEVCVVCKERKKECARCFCMRGPVLPGTQQKGKADVELSRAGPKSFGEDGQLKHDIKEMKNVQQTTSHLCAL